ncbi:MAG: cytochrome c biogenesis protein CcsA [Rickettsiales bacterium]|nr:cytochrome c biogenesis protein CcsA [Rickettsiales bacterium]
MISTLASETARADDFNGPAFRQIPILHEGRVKPLDSFARALLLAVYGKTSLPDMSAASWLAELLFDAQKSYQRRVFNIPNPEVLNALRLGWRSEHIYSFEELSTAFQTNQSMLHSLAGLEDSQRTPAQQQLWELYFKTLTYIAVSESLSLIQPRFIIEDQSFSDRLHLPKGEELTFLDLLPHETEIFSLVSKSEHKEPNQLKEKSLAILAINYTQISQQRKATIFRIIPPQWQHDGELWTAPWETLLEGHGSPQTAEYMEQWKKLAFAYAHHDLPAWNFTATQSRDMAYQMAGKHASAFHQKLEVLYAQANIFVIALSIYIASFVLLMTALLSHQRIFYKVAALVMPVGALLHFTGIGLRIVIMNRPPVATLYETTIFVSLIAVVLSLLFERKRKEGTSIIVGAIIGIVLLFISTRYAADGDTMEMLVAVLNTNFWLATHVVTVTMGYGCSLVAGTLGHIYLINKFMRPKDTVAHTNILNTMLAVGLIAVFFALLGTILGGIWADQSWGRFWGWDPKENGALLIVLWLLCLLHGKVSNVLSPLNFASIMALTNVIVALSWFGVNLLGVGLHSYGYTNNIAADLAVFCGVEIAFVIIMRLLLKQKVRI